MIDGNLRLHKIASNDPIVMQSFDVKDLVKDLIDLNVAHDALPTQRSPGLMWDLQKMLLALNSIGRRNLTLGEGFCHVLTVHLTP